MAGHSILVFFAFLVVLVTFQPRRRRCVVPYVPFDIAGGHSMHRLLPFFAVMAWRQRFPRRMWWVEPRQYIHHDIVEGDLWHTSPQMLNLRYWQIYHMEFLALGLWWIY
jgi:hypothetical protein